MYLGLDLSKYQYPKAQNFNGLSQVKKNDLLDVDNKSNVSQMISLEEIDLLKSSTSEFATKQITYYMKNCELDNESLQSTPKLNADSRDKELVLNKQSNGIKKVGKFITNLPAAGAKDIAFSSEELSNFIDCLVFTEIVGFGGLMTFGEDRFMYRDQWSDDPVNKLKDNLYYRWTWNQYSFENDILGHGGLAWALYGNARYNYGLSRTQSALLGIIANNLHEINESPVARGLAGKDAVYTSSMCVVSGLMDWMAEGIGNNVDSAWGERIKLTLQSPFRVMKFMPKVSLGYQNEKFSASYKCKWDDIVSENDNKDNYKSLKVTQLEYWKPKLQIQHNLLQNRTSASLNYSSKNNGNESVITSSTSGVLDFNVSLGIGGFYLGGGVGGYNFSNELDRSQTNGSIYIDNGEISPYLYAKANLFENESWALSTETMVDYSKTKIFNTKKAKRSRHSEISINTNLTVMGRLGFKTSSYNSFGIKAGVTLPAFDHQMGVKAGDYQLISADPQLYLGIDFTKSKINIGQLMKSFAKEFVS